MSKITKTHRLIWASALALIVLLCVVPPTQIEYKWGWINFGHMPIWQREGARIHTIRLVCEVLAITGLTVIVTILLPEITALITKIRERCHRGKFGHQLTPSQSYRRDRRVVLGFFAVLALFIIYAVFIFKP